MPYITRHRREDITDGDRIELAEIKFSGELNFAIQLLALAYTKNLEDYTGDPPNYTVYNSVIGAMEAAKEEYYRRVVAPYEDIKIKENGDVF